MFNSCFNCTKRFIGCHATCDDYWKFKKARQAENNAKQLDNLGESYSLAFQRSYYKKKSS